MLIDIYLGDPINYIKNDVGKPMTKGRYLTNPEKNKVDPHGMVYRAGGFPGDGIGPWHDAHHNLLMQFCDEAGVHAEHEPPIFTKLLPQDESLDNDEIRAKRGLIPDGIVNVPINFTGTNAKVLEDYNENVEHLFEIKTLHGGPDDSENYKVRAQDTPVNRRAKAIWSKTGNGYYVKAAKADAKWFQTTSDTEGPITKVMNQYPKLSLVIGEFGELSDDFSKLLCVRPCALSSQGIQC